MNLDHLSARARAALQDARTVARRHRHEQIEVEHYLLALVVQDEGVVTPALKRLGVDLNYLARRLDHEVGRYPKSFNASDAWPSARLEAVLGAAVREARRQNREFAETTDVLIAIVQAPSGPAPVMLRSMNVTRDALLRVFPEVGGAQREARGPAPGELGGGGASGGAGGGSSTSGEGGGSEPPAEPLWRARPGAYPNLEKFGRDITQLAAQGKLDPVVGRDDEIRRVMQVLSRRTKNNPVLVGEPGVGKTAIVEALAQRIVAGDVPDSLRNKMLVSLDMGALISGARLRGMFEERLKGVIQEIIDARGEILLFVDEIHSLVGAGAGDGGVDASSMLKPALARGQLRTMGTTTIKEYRYIEKDRALERRFQPIMVEEPTVDQAIAILRGVRSKYELHHGVEIRDEAVIAAVKLADRYITDRSLPDKAIDLIDEAASRLRIEIESVPEEIDVLQRRLANLEMEQKALEREVDADSRERHAAFGPEIESLRRQIAELQAEWKVEKDAMVEIRALREVLEKTEKEIEQAKSAGDTARAAELRWDKLEVLKKQLEDQQKKLASVGGPEGKRLLDEHVDANHIAEVVGQWTGIPVSKMLESEREKLLKIEERLQERVIGQPEAVSSIARAVRRARAGLQDPNRPIGSFIFLGPSGVGKTELAKALAEFLFDNERAMVRLDMSEFMEKHQVARLIGPPPGYQGHEEGGQLTEAVRLNPYSVVLLDEVEKAHPDVFNVMLQLLDDGRLTDGKGRTVDFTNTVVIMTSNLGSRFILDLLRTDPEQMRVKVFEALEKHFRPEFLGRIDAKIIFNSLDKENIKKILGLQMRRIHRLLAERKLTLELTDAARDWLAEEGYHPEFGARPVKQAILEHVQDPLAMELLEGDFAEGDAIRVDLDPSGTKLRFERIARGGVTPVTTPGDEPPPPPPQHPPRTSPTPASPFETIGGSGGSLAPSKT